MNIQDLENLIEIENEGSIDDNDYGVIIGPDGKLKMLLLPDDFETAEDVPDVIAQIIALFNENTVDKRHIVLH